MYDEFSREAMVQYKELPYETNELYKKYKLNINLLEPDQVNAPEDREWKQLHYEVSERFRIRFDAVICNGFMVHRSDNSAPIVSNSPEGLGEGFLKEKLFNNHDDRFAAYTHAYSKEVIDIHPSGSSSINLLFITTKNPPPVQVRIRCGADSNTKLNEFYVSKTEGTTTSGSMHEIQSEKGSKIEMSMLHMEDKYTDVFSLVKGRASEESTIKTNFICAGGRHMRHRNEIDAVGKNSKIETNDAVVGFDSTKVDIGTTTRNLEKMTHSISTANAAMFDDSIAYIKGFAKIAKGSAKSVSRINERGIINGKNSYLYLVPDMSIDESDVIATHSGASAPVEEDKIFYLQSHGISKESAEFLIMAGLMLDVVSRISDASTQIIVYSMIVDKIRNKSFGIPKITSMGEVWLPVHKGENR